MSCDLCLIYQIWEWTDSQDDKMALIIQFKIQNIKRNWYYYLSNSARIFYALVRSYRGQALEQGLSVYVP